MVKEFLDYWPNEVIIGIKINKRYLMDCAIIEYAEDDRGISLIKV